MNLLAAALLSAAPVLAGPLDRPAHWDRLPAIHPHRYPMAFSRQRMQFKKELRAWRSTLPSWFLQQIPPSADTFPPTPAWSNALVSPGSGYASEVSMDTSLLYPLKLASSANDDRINLSTNGGNSFTFNSFAGNASGPCGAGGSAGDPALVYDWNDIAVLSTLWNGLEGVQTVRSTNGGINWGNPVVVACNTNGDDDDKNWTAADRSGGAFNGNFYTAWDRYFGSGGEAVVCSRSLDSAQSWLPFAQVRGNSYYPTIVVGRDGVVYVAATQSSVMVCRSTDGGVTFPGSLQSAGFNLVGNGGVAPNYGFIQPGLDVDRDPNSPFYNRVYLSVVDGRTGQTHAHVWLRYSTDGGATWSTPVQVDGDNGDTTEHQYTWVSTGPAGGEVHVYYYAFGCGGNGINQQYRYWMASSMDGGLTWHQSCVQDTATIWSTNRGASNWVGDYVGGTSNWSVSYPHWADCRNGTNSIQSYTQPVPNPMPYLTGVSPSTMAAGTSGTFVISGAYLASTATPFAVTFDDAGITASVSSASFGTLQLNVNVGASVPAGPHEFSIRWGIPVAGQTVSAAIQSSCKYVLNVTQPSPTPGGPTQTFTVSPTPAACLLGYNLVGASNATATGAYRATGFTISNSAIVGSLVVYCASGGWNLSAALYTSNGTNTAPNSRVVQSSAAAVTGAGWVTLAVTPTLLAPGSYWIACKNDGTSGNFFRLASPATAMPNPIIGRVILTGQAWGGGAWPATFPGGSTLTPGEAYSLYGTCGYATVTPTSTPGGPSMSATATRTDSRTATISRTPTITFTMTNSWTPGPSWTETYTRTISGTRTISSTRTWTRTPTVSWTSTPTESATFTVTETPAAVGPPVPFPNPYSVESAMGIRFVDCPPFAEVTLFNVAGERLLVLTADEFGYLFWDATANGVPMSKGTYLYRASWDDIVTGERKTGKGSIVLVR